jgi:RNA polymerase sigma factor (TIGR02999 family)
MSRVTRILCQIENGSDHAADRLLPLVYDELRRLAASNLAAEKPGQTLEATALVHEAYIQLVEREHRDKWQCRAHFFSAAAEAMRRILVDNARRKRRLKRGAGLARIDLDEKTIAGPGFDGDLLDLDAALNKLQEKDPRKVELVKLRYFAGLTVEEAARALGIGTSTADRDWAYARAWLYREITRGADPRGD